MTERSVGRGMSGGVGGGMDRSMDKRKVCVFLILVAVALVCLILMAYMLFYASPRANSTLQHGGHSSLRLETRTSVRS
jgi:hypothetical protein